MQDLRKVHNYVTWTIITVFVVWLLIIHKIVDDCWRQIFGLDIYVVMGWVGPGAVLSAPHPFIQ